MIWKDIKAKTLEGLISVLNKELRHLTNNLDENNVTFKHIKTIPTASTNVPIPITGGNIFIEGGDVKIKFSDGSIKKFTLT